MYISARGIKSIRKWQECANCRHIIYKGESCVSAFGKSVDDRSVKPYRIWVHWFCAENDLKHHIDQNKEGKFKKARLVKQASK